MTSAETTQQGHTYDPNCLMCRGNGTWKTEDGPLRCACGKPSLRLLKDDIQKLISQIEYAVDHYHVPDKNGKKPHSRLLFLRVTKARKALTDAVVAIELDRELQEKEEPKNGRPVQGRKGRNTPASRKRT